MKNMKKHLRCFCLMMASVFIFAAGANAQMAVTDPITDPLMVLNIPKLAEQLEVLKDQVESLKDFNWNNQGNSQQLQNLTSYLQQSGNLAANASSVNSEFQKYFPGYKPPEGSDYNSQYSHIIGDTNNALSSVMQLMASINSQSDPMGQNANLQKIQMEIKGAKGQVQATQGLAQITGQLASNLEVLQKTIAAQASAQDAYYETQLQTQASNQAGQKQMFDNGQKTAPPIGQSGESIHIEG